MRHPQLRPRRGIGTGAKGLDVVGRSLGAHNHRRFVSVRNQPCQGAIFAIGESIAPNIGRYLGEAMLNTGPAQNKMRRPLDAATARFSSRIAKSRSLHCLPISSRPAVSVPVLAAVSWQRFRPADAPVTKWLTTNCVTNTACNCDDTRSWEHGQRYHQRTSHHHSHWQLIGDSCLVSLTAIAAAGSCPEKGAASAHFGLTYMRAFRNPARLNAHGGHAPKRGKRAFPVAEEIRRNMR
jgi:hypothetical protein